MGTQLEHWQSVYQGKDEQRTSWYRPHLDESLRLIDSLSLPADAPLVDIGGGRSTLVDDLLARGFSEITVLDLSDAALREARARLGEAAERVHWIAGDVLACHFPENHFGLWHDRAVFHFLGSQVEQARYAELARRSIRPGGALVIATFAEDGPAQCSGLPVCRYSAEALAARFADGFDAVASSREIHRTPFATEQPFTYLLLRRSDTATTTNNQTRALRAPD